MKEHKSAISQSLLSISMVLVVCTPLAAQYKDNLGKALQEAIQQDRLIPSDHKHSPGA